NLGWLPRQRAEAIAHIARAVRDDDGSSDLARQFGGLSYRDVFAGTNAAVPQVYRLPPEFRIVVESSTDQDIVNAVAKLIAAYVHRLRFAQKTPDGTPIRSPFAVFLAFNGLPVQPDAGETPFAYSRRLLGLVNAREQAGTLRFVSANPNRADGRFQ